MGEDRLDTKTRILDAAEQIFKTVGPEKVTLRRISAEAGVNLAAINYHFGSKEELGTALMVRLMGPFEERRLALLDEAENAAGDDGPSLATIIRCFLIPVEEFGRRYPNHHTLFMNIYRAFEDETHFKAQMRKLLHRTERRFLGAIFRALPDTPREILVSRFMFMWFTAHVLLHSGPQEDVEEILGIEVNQEGRFEDLVDFLVRGLSGA